MRVVSEAVERVRPPRKGRLGSGSRTGSRRFPRARLETHFGSTGRTLQARSGPTLPKKGQGQSAPGPAVALVRAVKTFLSGGERSYKKTGRGEIPAPSQDCHFCQKRFVTHGPRAASGRKQSFRAGIPQEIAAAIAEHTLENLDLTEETINQIHDMPYEELLAAGSAAMDAVEEKWLAEDLSWRPTVDGEFIPAAPSENWQQYPRSFLRMLVQRFRLPLIVFCFQRP